MSVVFPSRCYYQRSTINKHSKTITCSAVNWDAEIQMLNLRIKNQRQSGERDTRADNYLFSEDSLSTFRRRVSFTKFRDESVSSRPDLPPDSQQHEKNIENIMNIQEWHAAQWRKLREIMDQQDDSNDEYKGENI
eukprot:TRINITY_DN462_c0_g1_i5.p4 TRINITY_DN462_c0_g1~~TRINITY_DN462_c0_g1_i5.p4  ORF type:complete len:135 (-),score=4.07 TRINITY_DN462_c0_g1_i5:291-695(-)